MKVRDNKQKKVEEEAERRRSKFAGAQEMPKCQLYDEMFISIPTGTRYIL